MGGLANPMKDFRFTLEIDGLNTFLIQEVDPPELELPVIKHGAPGNQPDAKTPGKPQVGQLVLKKLKMARFADAWAHDWFASTIAGIASEFYRVAFLKELGPDAVTTVNKYFLGNVWPSKIVETTLVATGSNNLIQTVTFECENYVHEGSPLFNQLLGGAGAVAGGVGFLSGISDS